jgi:hypothetical protein
MRNMRNEIENEISTKQALTRGLLSACLLSYLLAFAGTDRPGGIIKDISAIFSLFCYLSTLQKTLNLKPVATMAGILGGGAVSAIAVMSLKDDSVLKTNAFRR